MEALRTKLVATIEGRDEQFAHWVTRIELTAEGASTPRRKALAHELSPDGSEMV